MSVIILPDTEPSTICECHLDEDNLVILERDGRVNTIALQTLKSEELLEAYGAKAAMQRLYTPIGKRGLKINYNQYCRDDLPSHLATAVLVTVVGALVGFAYGTSNVIPGGIIGLSLFGIISILRSSIGILAVQASEEPQLLANVKLGVENLDKILALTDEKESRIDFGMLAKQRELLTTVLANSAHDPIETSAK